MSGIGVVILAAGQSRRFGEDKRLQRLESGKTLLESTIRLYTDVFSRIVVTLRADDLT